MLELFPSPVLVLAAHPDDIELGCFGTLARLTQAGAEVHALVLSEGEPTGSKYRPIECHEAMALIGVVPTILPYVNDDVVPNQRMVKECETHGGSPRTVLTLTRWDTHQDHRAVEAIATSAFRRRPINIIGYPTVGVTKDWVPNVWVGLNTEHVALKVEALRKHTTQQGKPYFSDHTILSSLHDRTASNSGVAQCETFFAFQVFG